MYLLYHSPYSQHARRVVSLLEAAALPYRLRPVAMEDNEHLSPAYRAINPNGQVPTLVDDDLVLQESNAILRYLCNKHGLESWYPADPRRRAKVDQWLDWNQGSLYPTVADIVRNTVFMGDKGDQAAIERGRDRLPALAEILEAALEDSPYLVGNEATIADLSVASNVFQLGFAEARPVTPQLSAWFERISAIDGFRASLPAG